VVLYAGRRQDVLLIADRVGKTHDGDKKLFENLSVTLVAGDKLAVVGPNGAGKSTLLNVVAGALDPDSGKISRNKGARIGYLPQGDLLMAEDAVDHKLDDMTVLEAVLASDSDMAKAVQEYQRALAAAAGGVTPELGVALEKMNNLNAWEVDAEARRMLEAVGLKDANAKVGNLSGGQRRRLALASALLGSPDLLVLDEPTNHMDVEMISWMEKELLNRSDMAVVLVSHDRAFMEATCEKLLELDFGSGYMHRFGGDGSYEKFQQAREARRHAQMNAVADAKTIYRKEVEWMARQPKARSTKSRARVNAFYELTERTKALPQADVRPDFGNVGMVRQGTKTVVLKGITYSTPTGNKLLDNFTYEFSRGERIGVAGKNGVGKSTLLDLIAGLREADAGVREVGETAVIGYFTQYPPEVDEDLRLIDYIRDVADTRKARAAGAAGDPLLPPEILLEKLGFPRKKQMQKVSSLSGGERRRLHLAAVLAGAPNILILDEPTNDLDLATIEVMEELLANYTGLLLVVSHDRRFMDGMVDRLLVLPGDGKAQVFDGPYSEYITLLEEQEQQQRQQQEQQQQQQQAGRKRQPTGSQNGNGSSASSNGSSSSKASSNGKLSGNGKASSSSSSPPKQSQKRKLGYFEEQEYKNLEKDIETLGAQRDSLNDKLVALASSGADLANIEATSTELAALSDKIDAFEARWLELAEIAGDI